MTQRPRWTGRGLGLALIVALPLLIVASVRFGSTDAVGDFASIVRGSFAALALCEPLSDPSEQWIVSLRLWRALTAAGVGAALGLSGALVQGLFRNGLASPSVLGITGGASLGAVCAVIVVGGYGPRLVWTDPGPTSGMVIVPLCAFAGALSVGGLVYALSSTAGQVSIPALLLIGIAVNTVTGGVLQLIQVLLIGDWEVSRSILAWTFGTLDDRSGWHAATVWTGCLLAAAVVPYVAWELDILQAGLEDAQALGVHTSRVRLLALCAAALSASAAVAVAGQIAFVGLVVPHVVRILSGASHRSLLPLSALFGAAFLLSADIAQRAVLRQHALQPGVMMSLVGGPCFVYLVWRKRREIGLW